MPIFETDDYQIEMQSIMGRAAYEAFQTSENNLPRNCAVSENNLPVNLNDWNDRVKPIQTVYIDDKDLRGLWKIADTLRMMARSKTTPSDQPACTP